MGVARKKELYERQEKNSRFWCVTEKSLYLYGVFAPRMSF
jgi:hypothetical protein